MIAAFMDMQKNSMGAAVNMIASALAITSLRKASIILLESGFGKHYIEDAIAGSARLMVSEPFAYMGGEGMDYLIKHSRHNMLSERTAGDGVVYIKSNLGYVPSALRKNRMIYEEEFSQECQNILCQLDKLADYVFIDCSCVSETVQNKIQEQARLVILNVAQSEYVLDEYFSCLPAFHHKSLYCIGNYISEEPYNLKNIQRLYRIETQQIGTIPYNVEFLSSMQRGKTLSFFDGHPMRSRLRRNKDFFNAVFKMADVILHWKETGYA